MFQNHTHTHTDISVTVAALYIYQVAHGKVCILHYIRHPLSFHKVYNFPHTMNSHSLNVNFRKVFFSLLSPIMDDGVFFRGKRQEKAIFLIVKIMIQHNKGIVGRCEEKNGQTHNTNILHQLMDCIQGNRHSLHTHLISKRRINACLWNQERNSLNSPINNRRATIKFSTFLPTPGNENSFNDIHFIYAH